MKHLISLFIILLSCCGPIFSPKKTQEFNKLQALQNKSELYVSLISSHQDKYGFIMTDKCDALLFSGLLSAARPDLDIEITAARGKHDFWYRRPGHDCGPKFGNSNSTISRDMMIGLLWHLWRNKDLQTANELMLGLKKNLYWMKGQGNAGTLLWTPSLLNTLAQIILVLGGPEYRTELLLPASFSKLDGYRAHLAVWHLHLRGEIFGNISEDDLNVLKYHVERNPKNPLFQAAYHKYTDGIQDTAILLLLDSNEWPANKLPTTKEHCEEWPIQRDYTEKDWGPCPAHIPFKEYSGAELITIYELFIK